MHFGSMLLLQGISANLKMTLGVPSAEIVMNAPFRPEETVSYALAIPRITHCSVYCYWLVIVLALS